MNYLRLPKMAFKLMFTSRYLVLLAFLPGLITLALTTVSLVGVWNLWLVDISRWISIPIAFITFPIFWLVYGNLATIPIEDPLIDQVQRKLWNEIRVPAPDFHPGRLTREIIYSVSISFLFFILVLISFIPGLAILSYIIAAWATAWGFLSPYYARVETSFGGKLGRFFGNTIGNTALGAFLNLLLFVPILNVWLLGYALVLSTLLELERHDRIQGAVKP